MAEGSDKGSSEGRGDAPAPAASRRTTPKGTVPGAPKVSAKQTAAPATRRAATPAPSRVTAPPGRYTPPTPKIEKVSPPWVPALMFTLLLLGASVVVLNYLGVLPGGASNLYLLLGLGLITGGFVTATQYH